MKIQKQKYRHDPDNGVYGDCHRTAIAMLLDMDRDEVPHFAELALTTDTGSMDSLVNAWLFDRGFTPINVVYQLPLDSVLSSMRVLNPDVYYLLGGISRTGCGHTVVGLNDQIWADPSLDNSGIVGPMEDGLYWVTFLVPNRFVVNYQQITPNPAIAMTEGFRAADACTGGTIDKQAAAMREAIRVTLEQVV